jgi:chemotaxis protein MotB
MAFQRRAGNRFSGAIWPGFVDAITSLLMVMIFVLTIFMVVQYVLGEEINNQDDDLNALNAQLNDLSEALGLEATRADRLESRVATLTGSLSAAEARAAEQDALPASRLRGSGRRPPSRPSRNRSRHFWRRIGSLARPATRRRPRRRRR